MKRFLPYLLAIILTVTTFPGCINWPVDTDQFDLGDTVQVHVGEKVYESEQVWVRVDSIKDGRCPIGLQCYWAGTAEVWLTVGTIEKTEQLYFSSYFDSLLTGTVLIEEPYGSRIEITLVNVNPYPIWNVTPKDKDIWASFAIGEMSVDRKPNLYLYPEKKTKMNVSMDFPHGGKVIESDPAYPENWKNIKVKPNGKIDKKYDYLYYECEIPDFWQYVEGWVLKQENLHDFFDMILEEYGFNEKEIEDFLEFWIPELKNSPYYIIYPQYTEMVNRVIKLWISPRPDSIMRVHFVISEFDKKFYLPVPEIPDFEEKGFVAREWGVILK